MQLQDTFKDFEFIHNLPGKKLLLKGNHDYWWGTLTSMRKYIKDIGFDGIYTFEKMKPEFHRF